MSYAFNFALLWACLWNMIIKWTLCDRLFWKQPQLSWRLALKRMHLRSVNYWSAQLIIKFNKKQSTNQPRVNQEGPLGDPGRPLGDQWWPLGDPERPLDDPWRPLGCPWQPLCDPTRPLGDPEWPLDDPLNDSGWLLGDPGWQRVTMGHPWMTQIDPQFTPR